MEPQYNFNEKHEPEHNVAVVDVSIINVMLVKANVTLYYGNVSSFLYFLGQLMILITIILCLQNTHKCQ